MDEEQAREDLAFMRSIVAAGDESQRTFGRAYFAAGLCYGGQCLLSVGQSLGWLPQDPRLGLAIGIGPTILFLILLTWMLRRDRAEAARGSLTSRAIGMVFACVGMTNLALIVAIGAVALAHHSLAIWLIYPCVVMILQGTSWLFAYALQRRLWLAAVAAGWFVTGIAMAAALAAGNLGGYVLVVSIALFAFMAAPGAYLMRSARDVG